MNKKFLILLLLVVIGYLGYQQYSLKSNTPIREQAGTGFYNGSKFSFNYPEEFTLTENNNEVKITSIPISKVDETKCQQLEDEQARAFCLRPSSQLSPNITIKFLTGNPNVLWENAKIGPEEETHTTNSYTYRVTHIADEFGGRRSYGLLLDNGLLLAYFDHEDSKGGNIFNKSDKYQLDDDQQKELLEQILSFLTVK